MAFAGHSHAPSGLEGFLKGAVGLGMFTLDPKLPVWKLLWI